MSIKKKFVAIAVVAGLVSSVSCGAEPESSASDEVSATVQSTEAVTEAETEPETVEETTEEVTEPETEPETGEETESEEAEHILTNAELLSLINNVFGMMTDGTFETDVQLAKDWDIIDPDAEIDPEAEITAEFLVSASMRSTGIVTGESSMDEIINCAVEKGVIEDEDLSNIDLTKAVDVVNAAHYAWSHRTFDTEINVELADGVINLNDVIDADECEIDGNTIKLPADFAETITAGTVFIVPDGSADGTAYKADSVTDNGDGTITINGNPADFMQVYGSIGD